MKKKKKFSEKGTANSKILQKIFNEDKIIESEQIKIKEILN